jgi:nucleotide-binding universal stress UspA family protein
MPNRFRLLIAYDGSPGASAMIDDLPNAGIPADARVLVVSVAERWLPPPSIYEVATGSHPLRGKEHAVRLAELGASRVSALNPQWAVEAEGHTGSPARVILQRAREWNANLTMLGSQGLGSVERALLGSVSQKVANEAHGSVRIVRGGTRVPGPLRLLLAHDACAGADGAAASIATRPWPKGTQVLVAAATGFDGPPLGDYTVDTDRDAIEKLLAPVVQLLQEADLDVRTLIQDADPKNWIAEQAMIWQAHCVFVGCNDHTILERVLLGTVSGAILARAHCPVEVVR